MIKTRITIGFEGDPRVFTLWAVEDIFFDEPTICCATFKVM